PLPLDVHHVGAVDHDLGEGVVLDERPERTQGLEVARHLLRGAGTGGGGDHESVRSCGDGEMRGVLREPGAVVVAPQSIPSPVRPDSQPPRRAQEAIATASIRPAPACCSAYAAAAKVAPVVTTSSTSQTVPPPSRPSSQR